MDKFKIFVVIDDKPNLGRLQLQVEPDRIVLLADPSKGEIGEDEALIAIHNIEQALKKTNIEYEIMKRDTSCCDKVSDMAVIYSQK